MKKFENKTISLVLGSGAARGLAHIGAIRVLEQAGFKVAAVAGSSMGALVGGIYAAGQLDEYEAWVCELGELDVLKFLDIALGTKAGLLKGEAIIAALRDLLGDYQIQDLDIPFTAVATDLRARREIWLNRGSLFDAIRASIAIPGIFRPVKVKGHWLLDGGLLNPVPIAPTLNNPTDHTIAVNVMGTPTTHPLGDAPPRRPRQIASYRRRIEAFITSVQDKFGFEKGAVSFDDELSLTDVVLRSVETMQETITRFKLAAYQPDLLINVPVNVCQAHEFYRAGEIIAAGEYWTREALEHWQQGNR